MFNFLWKKCNKNCPHYEVKGSTCRLDQFNLAPSIKCLLVHICFLLRCFEIDREVEQSEDNWWKGGDDGESKEK